MNGPHSSSSHHSTSSTGRHKHHDQPLPKIRKAKSQSFRTRRSPSERRPNAPLGLGQAPLTLNTTLLSTSDRKRSPLTSKSPILQQPESKSPGSGSQKTPTTLSRQGTLRASFRRKNSITGSVILAQGRRSPLGFNDRSPQGRRSPVQISNDRLKSPHELPVHSAFGTHSPTQRSPTCDRSRSPTFSVHTQDRRSPIGAAAPLDTVLHRSPTVHVQDIHVGRDAFTANTDEARIPTGFPTIKRPSIGLFTPIYFSGDKRSPIASMPIPPITVSNPTETGKIVERYAESNNLAEAAEPLTTTQEECEKPEAANAAAAEKENTPEKKERSSVMREILAFVRKPSKHISTRTNRFANAFTRAESGSSSGPLIRQSTFSASPAASSTAAKSAVVKQMSEVGFEPKMSLKFAHYTKMSLKLRRSTASDDKMKPGAAASTTKRASSDSSSGLESSDAQYSGRSAGGGASGKASPLSDIPFELANVHFEKVGESYIKHDKIREEQQSEDMQDKSMADFVKEVASKTLHVDTLTAENAQVATSPTTGAATTHHFQRRSESREPMEPRISEEQEVDSNDIAMEEFHSEIAETLKAYKPEPIYVNLVELRREVEEAAAAKEVSVTAKAAAEAKEAAEALAAETTSDVRTMQCPIIEFQPPSRRSSFDPPRSPFLENLRSPSGGDADLINLQRLDSGGDSFDMIEGDRKSSRAESSFDYPYSSRDTSFDISRYQSTSYDDQTSSFEIVDMDERKKSNVDLRKSSIEMVSAEAFQRSGSTSGRKSSLETHFDYVPSDASGATPARSPNLPLTKKQKPDHLRTRDHTHISLFSAFSRARSPLSNQTSSNYSSRDSYDSSSSYPHSAPGAQLKSPFADPTRQHFPLTIKQREEEVKTFLCTDKRCASIFEPRPTSALTQQLSTGSMTTPSGCSNGTPRILMSSSISGAGCGYSSGSEFEMPSPRRAASASPKHTFTFRIVLKKVDSSPEALCPEKHRSRMIDRYRRRDSSRRKRLHDAGKSF